jgi:5'-phosphate synthase pdxT subunit
LITLQFNFMSTSSEERTPLVGVLALQGAFEEHQHCLEAVGCKTRQVRTPQELDGLDGIVLPGGESTAMGLIGTSGSAGNMWTALQEFKETKPTWGTCAGMILLAKKCVGTSAVIQNGQALIGGVDMLVCRNYFGSQVSSFEMPTPPPPLSNNQDSFPGVFIRAPAILSAGPGVEVLAKVVATPCRQAAVVLNELERKIEAGEKVVVMGLVDALERKSQQEISYKQVTNEMQEEKKEMMEESIELPGAADGTNAREVICVVRKDNVLCTAFHPELTRDCRWHEYFCNMVKDSMASSSPPSSC